ncbi:MAG: hypothetical protein A2Y76_04310 [Planctomycetes bacterium RBG_13_60_9]|nr:MAG: hypothetical protein A2Y76_04310 [Planctomycetes bacterium RBG_13_60_9]
MMKFYSSTRDGPAAIMDRPIARNIFRCVFLHLFEHIISAPRTAVSYRLAHEFKNPTIDHLKPLVWNIFLNVGKHSSHVQLATMLAQLEPLNPAAYLLWVSTRNIFPFSIWRWRRHSFALDNQYRIVDRIWACFDHDTFTWECRHIGMSVACLWFFMAEGYHGKISASTSVKKLAELRIQKVL